MDYLLPVLNHREEIVRSVIDNDITIIVAETGAGKSTQVPKFLHDVGFKVIATQPRRMAARALATRVAQELGTDLGQIVGFRTAEERYESAETRIVFRTDGLELMRNLGGSIPDRDTVLIIDEVHEWNTNIEALTAVVKRLQEDGQGLKVVLMSATMEAIKLSKYFDNAPIISIPGRRFPVTTYHSKRSPSAEAIELAENGQNVLVFVPGKAEIDKIIEIVEDQLGSGVMALPLHGELTAEEQDRVFVDYGIPKIIVSTNVAQTSITIDDIDAVVDTGQENRSEIRNGVRGLYTKPVSKADIQQRRGRAGRTRPGVYVYCSDIPISERLDFPIAEILRTSLEQLVLRLASVDVEATELEFFHQPPIDEITRAREVLRKFSTLDDHNNITALGLRISALPLDVRLACMVVEAERRGVINEVLSIVSCLEAGGIRGKGLKDKKGRRRSPRWPSLTDEIDSDLLAELDCFMAATEMNIEQMIRNDIIVKRFINALEIRTRLADEFGVSATPEALGDRHQVLKATLAGMFDRLHGYRDGAGYVGLDGRARQIDRYSIVNQTGGVWVTGIPFDVGTSESKIVHILNSVSTIELGWLTELAPHLLRDTYIAHRYSKKHKEIRAELKRHFNDLEIGVFYSEITDTDAAKRALAHALACEVVDYPDRNFNREVILKAKRISVKYPNEVRSFTLDRLEQAYFELLGDVHTVEQLKNTTLRLKLSCFVPLGIIKRDNRNDEEISSRRFTPVFA